MAAKESDGDGILPIEGLAVEKVHSLLYIWCRRMCFYE